MTYMSNMPAPHCHRPKTVLVVTQSQGLFDGDNPHVFRVYLIDPEAAAQARYLFEGFGWDVKQHYAGTVKCKVCGDKINLLETPEIETAAFCWTCDPAVVFPDFDSAKVEDQP